jgi:hypothetical protein
MGRAILALLAVGLFSCSAEVADIDRTQGNLIRKADLAGEWHLLQTVVGVPATTGFTFEGETGRLERVRWAIHENFLVAYRSYELLPGSEHPATAQPFDGTENPVAAYPIVAHVDVLRDYNAQTGEQSNVIVENTSDRLWHERDFVRVDWSASEVVNFDFIAPTRSEVSLAYFTPFEQGGPDALYQEHSTEGALNYFDVTGKVFVEPDLWGCIYSWYGWAAEDCSSAEISIRTSMSKVAESSYRAFHYNDQLMSRFGYFRTEFFTYDALRGVTDQGRRLLINRHHIWEASVDEAGAVIPVPERAIKSVAYYLSTDFPQDALLEAAAQATMDQWSDGLLEGLGAVLGAGDHAKPFVLCHTPVAEGDPSACGAEGFAPRMGDLRYSTLHWVDTETLIGLLGYGPSAADPVTGEIISGKAYIYGAAVSTWATYAVDVIRYFNEELDFETLTHGSQGFEEVLARLENRPDGAARASERLDQVPLDRPMHRERRPERPSTTRAQLRPYDATRFEAKLTQAQASGASSMLLNDEVKRAVAGRQGTTWDALDAQTQARLDPARTLNPITLKRLMKQRKASIARSADLADMIQPDLEGLIRSYAGRTDYDEIQRAIRADIFAAVAEHEVGHTLGLRHNFQGSYDSLNYPDQYWSLREENLSEAESLGDIYRLSNLTEAQHEGQMRQLQYSSIMDYGFGWANDLAGLGKYDKAALVFGYTAGGYTASGARCEAWPSVAQGSGCVAQLPGVVPVFKKRKQDLRTAGELLTGTELGFTFDDPGLPSVTLLERVHYTTLALAFSSLDDFAEAGRTFMSYADFLEGKEGGEDRAVRVPFMFCSDEWEGGLLSCHAWDQGADPFELVRSKIDDYRSNYAFVNFRRDRPWFDVWNPLFSYYFRTFLPLSDIFQSWYVAPYGHDPLFDRTYDLAVNAGFSLLGEVLATPAYGRFCEARGGRLVHLSDEPVLQGDEYVDPDCIEGGRSVVIEPGQGRRPFSAYDVNAGYLFAYKPQEAGHVWTTMAAVWALVDPEAYLVGVDGDAGTYAISFYDWFGDEFDALAANVLTQNYAAFAPRGTPEEQDGVFKVKLQYPPAAPLYDRALGGYFNAETGAEVAGDPTAGPLAGAVGMCEVCTVDVDCAGHTGGLGGTYCQPLADGARVCLQDCTNDEGLCTAGTVCDDIGNCVPGDELAACDAYAGACDGDHLTGACDQGSTCVDGACVAYPWTPVIESDPTFSLATDILWWGFLFTTASYSTRFNDGLNVFRPGSPNAVEADPELSETVRFTDPVSGITYAGVQPRCTGDSVSGGPDGLCSPCTGSAQCAGYTGFLDGVYCQPIGDDDNGPAFCVQDCTNDAAQCGAGDVCDARGNCVPANGVCYAPRACSEADPQGRCEAGQTCSEGACTETFTPSATCEFLRPGDTGAVQLVRRGQSLATAYEASLAAWYSYDGPSETEDNRLARRYFSDRYSLRRHVDLLETVQATYGVFGRIY